MARDDVRLARVRERMAAGGIAAIVACAPDNVLYLTTAAERVGAERGIVLGKKRGIDTIRIALERLGLEVPPERHAELLAEVKRQGTTTRSLVPDDAFRRLARKLARSAPPAESKR